MVTNIVLIGYCIALALVIVKRNRGNWLMPSVFVMALFIIIPPIGMLGYEVYVSVHGSYYGTFLPFEKPLFIWYLGVAAFGTPIFLLHLLRRRVRLAKWRWRIGGLKIIMLVFFISSLLASSIAIWKLGYVPVLKGEIEAERFSYAALVGPSIYKFSRLWVIVFVCALVLFYQANKTWGYIPILLMSFFFLSIFSQRQYLILVAFMALWFHVKYTPEIGKLRIIIVGTGLYCLYLIIGIFRRVQYSPIDDYPFYYKALYSTFGEWREFSFVVNNFRADQDYLGSTGLTGAFATLLPHQIWDLLGYDKQELLSLNLTNYFGNYFDHHSGIRIGIIGEAFASYGVSSVVVMMLILGIIFAWLDKTYIAIDKGNPLFILVVFPIAVMSVLPMLSIINIVGTIYFFTFFLVIVIAGAAVFRPRLRQMSAGPICRK